MKFNHQEDYLLRIIEQLAAAIASVIRDAFKLVGTGDFAEAIDRILDGTVRLLGTRAEVLMRLDSETAATIVADPSQLLLWAQLSEAEARAHAAMGALDRAQACARRSAELALEAWDRDRSLDPQSIVDGYLADFPPGEMMPKYHLLYRQLGVAGGQIESLGN